MAGKGFPLQEYWRHFFATAPAGSWRIWLHCQDYSACSQQLQESNKLGVVLVPTVPSEYCFDLVSPMAQLARYAVDAATGDSDKFVFLSDATLPVKSFSEVQEGLLRDDQSDMCLKGNQKNVVLTSGSREHALIRHTQWVVLSREHARLFAQRWMQAPRPQENRSVDFLVRDRSAVGNVNLLLKNFSCEVREDGASYRTTLCDGCGPTDSVALFASIFGAVTMDEFPYDDDLGALKERIGRGWTERCHTFASWYRPAGYATTAPGWQGGPMSWVGTPSSVDTLAAGMSRLIFKDVGTEHHGHELGAGSHPWTFDTISEQSFRLLRCSPFLFARKFAHDIDLPFFKDVLARENAGKVCDRMSVKVGDGPGDISPESFSAVKRT